MRSIKVCIVSCVWYLCNSQALKKKSLIILLKAVHGIHGRSLCCIVYASFFSNWMVLCRLPNENNRNENVCKIFSMLNSCCSILLFENITLHTRFNSGLQFGLNQYTHFCCLSTKWNFYANVSTIQLDIATIRISFTKHCTPKITFKTFCTSHGFDLC